MARANPVAAIPLPPRPPGQLPANLLLGADRETRAERLYHGWPGSIQGVGNVPPGNYIFLVQTNAAAYYLVRSQRWFMGVRTLYRIDRQCECPDFVNRRPQAGCKHMQAAARVSADGFYTWGEGAIIVTRAQRATVLDGLDLAGVVAIYYAARGRIHNLLAGDRPEPAAPPAPPPVGGAESTRLPRTRPVPRARVERPKVRRVAREPRPSSERKPPSRKKLQVLIFSRPEKFSQKKIYTLKFTRFFFSEKFSRPKIFLKKKHGP